MQVCAMGEAPQTLKFDGPDGYGQEVRYFVECVQNRRPPAVVTAQDGASALEICEAEEKSLKTGQVVPV
jgi:predicted dehydrogenase